MDYVDVETARGMPGLRLALTAGVPGPWGEVAKTFFKLQNVEYVPVLQAAAKDNPELVAWTGHRNAPIAIYNDEPPRVRWLEILHLAERLGDGPSLLPEDLPTRIQVVGLANEIAGESGFAWHGRILMLAAGHKAQGDAALTTHLYREYGYSVEAAAAAKDRVRTVLDYVTSLCEAQKAAGSDYLVGDSLTAVDVVWAYFSQLLNAYGPEKNPMPESLRKGWSAVARAISDYDPIIIEQRDRIFEKHLTLPLEF